MNLQEGRNTVLSTSAAGPMPARAWMGPSIASYIVASPGTSSMPVVVWYGIAQQYAWAQTSGGASIVIQEDTAGAVAELRRLSGLTWEQLARLFGVTRRSLHFWASGKPLTPANEERLNRTLATVRKIDRGSSGTNRALLLSARASGQIPFDLLVEGRYEPVVALVGSGDALLGPVSPRLSEVAQAARAPFAPERLADARQDRVHVEKGRLLSARAIRRPRGK